MLALATGVSLSLGAYSSSASPTKTQCIDANASAQDLRRAGQLSRAREQLRLCVDASCPALVRSDCTQRLDDLDHVQPSLVLDAKDATGADVVDVQVTIDGQPLATHLDGKPVNVDPGVHALTFETAGSPRVSRTILVKEGDAGRRERVVFRPALAPAPSAPEPATGPTLGARKTLALVLGGGGVVALGLGTAFGVLASSAWSNAKSACGGSASACTNLANGSAYRSTTETDGAVSTGTFIAGGALLAAGAVLFFTGSQSEGGKAHALAVTPLVAPGEAGIAVGGTF